MKHASAHTIQSLSYLIEKIRNFPQLKEKKSGIFYFKSKAFLHFHEDRTLIFADVRLTGAEFERMPCTTREEKEYLLKAIDQSLG